ncbi:MAG: hypothetical protein HY996_02020 [Micrococcales bacterium]|nr:hypothetical protein [Micrococcales bacterium]
MTDADRLGGEVDALVRGVPGVVRMFSSDPAALRAARGLLHGHADARPLSAVSAGVAGTRIVVSVGVSSGHPVAETGARVAQAIRILAGEDSQVTVRVSRVIDAG